VCRRALIDRETNTVSLIEVIEGIQIKAALSKSPKDGDGIPGPLEVVSFWARSDAAKPEETFLRVVLMTPKGKKMTGPTLKADLRTAKRARMMFRAPGFAYHGEGTYLFQIEEEDKKRKIWRRIVSVPVDLEIEPPSSSP
jgi:hypothetical protein